MALYELDLPLVALRCNARKLRTESRKLGRNANQRPRVNSKKLRLALTCDATDVLEAKEALAALAKARAKRNCTTSQSHLEPESEPCEEDEVSRGWNGLVRRIGQRFVWRVKQDLGYDTVLEPVYPESHVQKQFLDACKQYDHSITVTYHGTKARNVAPISKQGLMIPGHGGVIVANGSAHGLGIYTAQLGKASLSRGFCSGSNTMFVCAVCDTSAEPADENGPEAFVPSMMHVQTTFPKSFTFQGRKYGSFLCKRESKEVRHVGDAVVVFEEKCVVPVFTATIQEPKRQEEIHVYQPEHEEECWEVGPQQIGRRRLIVPEEEEGFIKFGTRSSGRSGKEVWLPAMHMHEATGHELTLQRRMKRAKWKLERKLYQRAKHEF